MAKTILVKASLDHRRPEVAQPPLGLLYIASSAREQGHESRIFDLRLDSRQWFRVQSEIETNKPGVLGISAMYPESPTVHKLALMAKKASGGKIKVVVGGPYASIASDEILKDPAVDVAVIGEGEKTFPLLLDALDKSSLKSLEQIPGIMFRSDGKTVKTPTAPLEMDLDSLPFPAWDLIDIDRYARAFRFAMLRSRRYMPLLTSRGCPYGCIYCHNLFGRRFRKRSPENVLKEMDILVNRYGIREYEIIDDIFNLDEERAAAICELMVRRGLDRPMSFPNGVRSDILSRGLMEKMKRAGTYLMAISVETASPRLQDFINKNLDICRVVETIENARELGITTVGYFMLGFPTETKEELKQTIDFACRSNLNLAAFFVVRPFAGTPLWKICREKAEAMSPEDFSYQKTGNNLHDQRPEEFSRMVRMAYLRFYSRWPSRMILSGAYNDVRFFNGLRELLARVIFK